MEGLQAVDAEAEFLAAKRQTGNEWELFKENVRPLKRGRNVALLNEALKSQTDNLLKKSLLEKRRKLIQAIDEYKGDDPLQPWIECIKWVQESFPSAGDFSGLVLIYEECARSFWNMDRYKDDSRYLKVWLEYAENCADAEVIYKFLYANEIGQTQSMYYISYALHLESKNKMKRADEIFNLAMSRKAQPAEKLEAAYKKFLKRATIPCRANEDEPIDSNFPTRSFGTVLTAVEARRQMTTEVDRVRKKGPFQMIDNNTAPLAVYNAAPCRSLAEHQPEPLNRTWNTLGTQKERNKENNAIPSKWTSGKIPQRIGSRTQPVAASPSIQVFVDDECAKLPPTQCPPECINPSILQLRRGDKKNFKKDTELLKENPLRNFPPNSLPR